MVQPALAPVSAEEDDLPEDLAEGVVIAELLPNARAGMETEYVAILGPLEDVDLGGWRICDAWSCVVLPPFGLGPNNPVIWAVVAWNASLYHRMKGVWPDIALEDAEAGEGVVPIVNGSWPVMANDGDFLVLEDAEGEVVDAVVFGAAYQGQGWTGPPAQVPGAGRTLARDTVLVDGYTYNLDTDTAEDWPASRSRRAELRPFSYDTFPYDTSAAHSISALVLPDDAGVLAGLVENATSEILVNVYGFTSLSMADLLAEAAGRGVAVSVLLEGHPVGGISRSGERVIDRLVKAGCEVRLLSSNVTEGRPGAFGYDHAKYMILDQEKVAVMSDNLVPSTLGTSDPVGNRGWALVTDGSLWGDFERLFWRDWSSLAAVDAVPYGVPDAPGWAETDLMASGIVRGLGLEGCWTVEHFVSPEGSEDHLIDILGHVEERLYVQMLACDLYWVSTGQEEVNPMLLATVEAARRGAEVKVLLDPNFPETSSNPDVVRFLRDVANREGLDLKARLAADIPGISMLHNKGVIADDTLVVSSMNWVASAFRDNREVGVAVEDGALADHLAGVFLEDWEPAPAGGKDGEVDQAGADGDDRRDLYPFCGGLLIVAAVVVLVLLYRRWKGLRPVMPVLKVRPDWVEGVPNRIRRRG